MNLATMLADRECGVRTVRTLGHLPNGVQKRLNSEYDNLPNLVLTLAETHLKGDLAMVHDKIKKVSDLLNANMAGDGNGNSLRENFVLFGGAHVVVRCLQVPVNAEEAKHSGWRGALAQEKDVWDLRKECLVLLRDLCYVTPVLSEQLCSQPNFIVFLFSLMRNQSTFDEAVGLTEEVLAFRGEIFNLSLVPDFEGLVNSLSKRQMAFFCRVLALVVFEPEDRPSEELKITKASDLLTARREQALSPAVKNTDRNHAVLLGIEELLPRMVKLVLVHAVPHRWADEIMQHLPTTHHFDLLNMLRGEDSNDWDDEPSATGFS
jgi:Trpc4-associated protein